ncbi:hypothetical protein Tco_1119885 [Tanacetum coccineum]
MEECHLLLTDQIDLVNPEGNQIMPDVSKPLPLGGPPGQVTIQTQYFFNKDLEYLVSGSKERRNALSISKLKATNNPDITLGLEELCTVTSGLKVNENTSHMRILSVVSLKTISRYSYTYLKEIVLRRADYNEYKISESDFKNLHPNDFEDLYLLHLQGKLNHLSRSEKVNLFNAVNMWIRNIMIRKRVEDLQLGIKSYQSKLNLIEPNWDASNFLFKEDYTIVSKPRAIIYKDRNDQNKMMRDNEVHKFSDGTLTRILEKLDHMVKDFKLFKYNPGMEKRVWSEDDKRRSKEFIEVIKRRLKIRRIFRSLESFNIRVIPKYHSEDGNPARANIKQALGSYKDGDGDGDTLFKQSQVHNRMLILDQHSFRYHESSSKGFNASANSDINFFLSMTK